MEQQWTVDSIIQQIVKNSRNNIEIDRPDVRAVIKTLATHPEHLNQHLLDILAAIRKLYKKGFITGPVRDRLIEKFVKTTESPKEQFCDLLCELFTDCSLTAIILFLRFNKIDMLANNIEEQRQIPPFLREDDIITTCNLFRYCNRIKLNFDNNIFHDCHKSTAQLQLMVEKRRQSLQSNDLGVYEVAKAAEELIVTIWVEINTLRDDQFDDRMAVLDKMMRAIPHNIETAFMYARLIFYTKGAVTHALARKWKDAFDFIRHAKHLLHTRPSRHHLVTVLMYHDFMYIYRLRYAETCDREDLQQVIHFGRSGIKTVRKISREDSLLWVRLFKINMAMARLAIGPKLDVNLQIDITQEDCRKAKALISYVAEERHHVSISSREEIYFFMCKSRILKENGELTRALEYARKAIEHSKEGTPFFVDRINVQKYLGCLARRRQTKAIRIAISVAIFFLTCLIFGMCLYW